MKKKKHFQLSNWYIFSMSKIKDFKKSQQIKDKQIKYLLADVEKNLEEYKIALEIKEKQLSEAKKNTRFCKTKLR